MEIAKAQASRDDSACSWRHGSGDTPATDISYHFAALRRHRQLFRRGFAAAPRPATKRMDCAQISWKEVVDAQIPWNAHPPTWQLRLRFAGSRISTMARLPRPPAQTHWGLFFAKRDQDLVPSRTQPG